MKRDQRSATIGRERSEFVHWWMAPVDRSPAQPPRRPQNSGVVSGAGAGSPRQPQADDSGDYRCGIAVRYGDVATRHIDVQAGGT